MTSTVTPIPKKLMMQTLAVKGLRLVHRPQNLVPLRIERQKRLGHCAGSLPPEAA
ncbi:MAG: hypothetical protein ACAH12_03470 [Methylophilaceae bacterium]